MSSHAFYHKKPSSFLFPPSTSSMDNANVPPKMKSGTEDYQLLMMARQSDLELLCPIRYVYNYLPHRTQWLIPQPISLNRVFPEPEQSRFAFIHHRANEKNSICLNTQAANLPLHTGLEKFRQSKYWRANDEATKELLELFAQDQRCSEIMLSNKRSMSSLAEEQLKTAVVDTYSRFSVYMFAEADETRIQLLAQSVILIFMFDGK